ncbi:MAG: hypothetical protein FWH52_07565 [Synergistaceae bacterium]|nr:hypothetical protein [Synergistaceae bacterium]
MRDLSISLANGTLSQDEKSILLAELTELAKEFSNETFRTTGMEIIAVGNGSLSDELMYKKGDTVYSEGKWIKLSEFDEKWAKEGKLDLDSATFLEVTEVGQGLAPAVWRLQIPRGRGKPLPNPFFIEDKGTVLLSSRTCESIMKKTCVFPFQAVLLRCQVCTGNYKHSFGSLSAKLSRADQYSRESYIFDTWAL